MEIRCISHGRPFEFGLTTDFPERLIDISFTHNDSERTIQRLCFSSCPQNPLGPIQFSLVLAAGACGVKVQLS
jgi:hypothetical protein